MYDVGVGLGVSDQVMLAGFEAGWVESRMNNLPCGDKDSLGVFQQRPSQGWGTPQQIMDVRYAATQFFVRAINSERRHPEFAAWQIAQDVQRSCCADRYAAAEATARALLNEVRIIPVTPRFVFVTASGSLLGKDGAFESWKGINSGGATRAVLDGDWIGWIENGNFYAKFGLYDSWRTMADGGLVKDIAISGNRFAFVDGTGVVRVKDGPDSNWTGINTGGASRVILDGNWIGWIEGNNFYAKYGINDTWRTMTDGGVKDIAISGNRFAFVDGAGILFAKDGPDSSWLNINGGGATKVRLKGDWIGWIEAGNFYAKHGLYDSWRTMADGGQVTDIALSDGDWFGFTGSGNYLAKQGPDANWLPMTDGGQVTNIAQRT